MEFLIKKQRLKVYKGDKGLYICHYKFTRSYGGKKFFTFFTKLLRNCFIRVANLRYFAKLKIKIWGKFRIFSKLSLLKDNHKKCQDKRINVLASGTCVQYVFSFSSGL